MKIVVLSNSPLVESQGSGYVITNYCRELRARGHKVEAHGPEQFEFMPWLRAARTWRLALGMALFALRHADVRRADLVEFYGGESWLAVLLLRVVDCRALLVHHSNGLETRISQELIDHSGVDTHDGRPRRWYQPRFHALTRQAFTQVDALVLVSEIEARYATEQRYQDHDRVLYIETPLPAEFQGLPFIAGRPLTVGYCGGWYARKGVALLKPVLIALLQRHPTLEVCLAGLGHDFQLAAEFPAELCGRIRLSPFMARKEDLQAWYGGVSIFLMPSYSESFGLVVSEAMACGCAVVGSKTGFCASLLDGVEALVVDTYALAPYVAAVESLLSDEERRQAIARRGYERVHRMDWNAAGARLEAFYASLRVPSPSGASAHRT
jgi:glycosyltransferase involved in cell wall biosynthesis